MSRSWGGARHLVGRFVSSVICRRPRPADEEWARAVLTESERRLWDRFGGPDRAHSVAVARRVETAMGAEITPVVLRAALLHDVGKIGAGLGTYGRAIATLCGIVGGQDMAPAWASKSGFTRRVGLYLEYPELGATDLELAGSDPLVIAWAREHHEPPDRWTVPPELGRVLAAADS